jgi:transcriptional regulator with XRE-family HTH domain
LKLQFGLYKLMVLKRGMSHTGMITSYQLRAARALLDIDQRETAELADLSVPTIQRMEASEGVIRGNVDSLMKLVSALEAAGIELIGPGGTSTSGGRGVRLREDVASPRVLRPRQPKSVAKSVGKAGASRAAAARDR